MTLLKLVEYGAPMRTRLDTAMLQALRAESEYWKQTLGLPEQPLQLAPRGRDGYAVRAQGVAGFLKVNDLSIEIQPKFLESAGDVTWRRALWRILAVTTDKFDPHAIVDASVVEDDSFVDLLGWTLLQSIRQGWLEGFPRGYVETEGVLPVLQGRLDAGRLASLLTRPDLVPCIYDVYQEDITINRLFRWAAYSLAPLVQSPSLGRMLSDEAGRFGDVGLIPPGIIEAEQLILPAQFEYLMPALHVARLLLRRQSLQHDVGVYQAPSFLWKSSDVFEEFVRYLMLGVTPGYSDWRVEKPTQVVASFDPAGHPSPRDVPAIPDFVLSSQGRVVLVLDAKYKRWGRQGHPLSGDVYQVMAAGRINGCSKACLIYPKQRRFGTTPLHWSLVGAGNPRTLTTLFIDLTLMGESSGEARLTQTLLDQISALVSDVDYPATAVAGSPSSL